MKKFHGIILCLAIGMMTLLLGGCSKNISIKDFVQVKAEGADGYGTISSSVKKDDLAKEIYGEEVKKVSLSDFKDASSAAEAYQEYQEKLAEYNKIKSALDNISIGLDKKSSLKNGDVVKVEIKYPESLEDELGVSLKDTEFEYKVSGLKKVQTIDAFAEDTMKLEYEGASPEVNVRVTNIATESPKNTISYSVEQEGPFKDGDQITVNAEYDEESLLDEGYVVKESSKTITIASDYKYIATAADLSDDFDAKLKNQAMDTIKAYMAEKPVKKSTWNYEGKYIRSFKGSEKSYGDNQNVIYYVFKGTVKPEDKTVKSKSVYMAVRYKDVIIGSDGTSTYIPSDNAEREEDGSEYMDVGDWNNINAYFTEQKLFDNCMQKYTDRYSVEVTDKLKNLG